ncbi:hypothetical protein HPB52_015862 [Rhipicephalus sanguineus]|uniref:Uncharacterized protein n=1 Tax=Rhipicephalus sanguineus TaxID=34632 RepID=A0A9D4YQF0_RHISA|nr:hypothetical protein HPB52_015862 [Rhipicephalus sanguineus]
MSAVRLGEELLERFLRLTLRALLYGHGLGRSTAWPLGSRGLGGGPRGIVSSGSSFALHSPSLRRISLAVFLLLRHGSVASGLFAPSALDPELPALPRVAAGWEVGARRGLRCSSGETQPDAAGRSKEMPLTDRKPPAERCYNPNAPCPPSTRFIVLARFVMVVRIRRN